MNTTPAVTYTTFNPISRNVITRSVQTFVPGLYSVTTEIDNQLTEVFFSGEEVLNLLQDDLKNVLTISFKSKALPSKVMGFSYFPAGFLVDDEPVVIAYNDETNNAFTTTLNRYHTARD